MDIELNHHEIEILDKVENDFAVHNQTNEKCPRCGKEFVLYEAEKSYIIRCKTDGCIVMCVRGI